MTLGEKIKNHRLNKGQTQKEYGKEFGAGKSLVCQWEKGINKPNRKRLKMIADDMGIAVVELLGSDEK
ncbi:transcriptional regulator [Staphylococcus hominis]|uniref:helix-turn-helix domain-containing protein n=1 Tax=Staphylococcus hominis TaxID=1290 RepID=UPI0008FB4D97|nr:helix-turn-helix transcriptional regulator [Staphylococcus hominis]KAF1683664.1 transcriptional regulator [Staphylococcus hominis]OIS43855.1 transcriptional regulator [Staphylococcus hominis]OIS49279.1 transcriptional regulator [Staphylococcus hominis]OIS50275.1 transcriptional regulator [Staphylococcus hominis]